MLLGEFGVGKITAQNKTKDVGYDAIRKQAAKFGNKVTKDGRPPLLRTNEAIDSIDTGKDDKFGINFENLRPQGKKLGTINGMVVYDSPNLGWGIFNDVYSGIVLWDPVAKIAAGERPRKREYSDDKFHSKTFLISVAAVNPKYEGRSLIFKLYVFLIRKGFALASDDTQSRGGRKLWERLAKTAGVNVYAVDQVNGEWVYSDVDPDDISDANFMVYDSDKDAYWNLKKEIKQLSDEQNKLVDILDNEPLDAAGLVDIKEKIAVISKELTAARLEYEAWNRHTDTGRNSRLMAVASRIATGESTLREGEYPLEDWNYWEGDRQYKEQGAKIVGMTPEEYLSRVKPLTMDPESKENIDILVAHVKDGGRLDPLKIYANGKEDGRHRAYAAKRLGIKRVPVVVWPQLNESYSPLQLAIMEGGHLLEDEAPTVDEIQEWLASVENEMEEVDDASRWAAEDGEDTADLERDYQALHAVEMVLRNHLTALRNPVLMDQSIFLYNIVTDAVQYAALHIVINGDVAELKWLGNLGRKGVGSKLLHDGLTQAKARGAKSAKLTTKWNSEGFYLKSGFKADSETKANAFSGSNNTDMSKTLESRLNEIESMALGKDWGEVSRWRWNGKNSDRVFKIGTVAGLSLVVEKSRYSGSMTVYLMNKAGDAVGEIQMEKEYNAWITDTTILTPEYQGKGLMLQAYVALAKAGIMLRSGKSQSPGGKKIWLALSKQPGITVYAGYETPSGKMVYSDIDDDADDRVHGAFDIYDLDATEIDREYRSEVFALQARADKLSARALQAKTPELKAKFAQEYKEVNDMLKKLEAEREAAEKKARPSSRDWEDSVLYAVADGVELNNRF